MYFYYLLIIYKLGGVARRKRQITTAADLDDIGKANISILLYSTLNYQSIYIYQNCHKTMVAV